MKKLILSAVFALACFTANAQTTSTPETKEIPTQVNEGNTRLLLTCCETRSVEVTCIGGSPFTISATRCARGNDCAGAALSAYAAYTDKQMQLVGIKYSNLRYFKRSTF